MSYGLAIRRLSMESPGIGGGAVFSQCPPTLEATY